VIVEDIATSPYWTKFKDAALAHGLRACWSDPILGANGRLLGTLAMYYTQPGKPTKHQLQLIDAATRLAAVALERANAQQERKNLEVQMRQAQKLESLGVLAGGIAHDFNNLLTGIMGYASLASYTLRETDTAAARHVLEIEKVAQRAANLTKQMLAYSGKGRFLVAPLDLGNLVDELARLLEISISKKARIHYSFSPNLPPIEADAAQVQQVVMNLITNASEALHDQPGDIRIETGVVNAKRDYLAGPYIDAELPEGRYVYVDVTDTGCGMDEETLARIFDPFYTTKFTGRGLGMSAVLGIMRGHRGTIKIESQPGAGTTVRLLFPVTEKQPIEPVETWSNRVLRREDTPAHGTVLIVDDEELVRALAAAILAEAGYRVLTAVDGEQALEVCSRHANEIDLILLDLMMPNRDGVETLRELRARGSSIPVILSSGYSELEVAKRVNGDRFEAFVQKPYTRDVILAAIERVLIDP
jgi:signal transduction histidine kinase/ActR/RegA family two-component response regulator